MSDDDTDKTRVRLDKWLWAARFYNTRSLAADEIAKGRVQVNGQAAKASREVREGDTIELRQQQSVRTVQVQALYAETEASIALRAKQAEQRRFGTEPAQAIEQGRPTKRDRRKLADWDRWSAAAEAPPRGRS